MREREPRGERAESVEDFTHIETDGLTRYEAKLLDAIPEASGLLATKLELKSLAPLRNRIVGVRTEDVIFFLQAISDGFIPAGGGALRLTEMGMGKYYLIVNPESDIVKQRPELLINYTHRRSFQEAAKHTAALYQGIGFSHGVMRNIITPFIRDPQDLQRRYYKRFVKPEGEINDGSFEHFLSRLQKDVGLSEDNVFSRPNSCPTAIFLAESLKENGQDPEKFIPVLLACAERTGLLLGLDEKFIIGRKVHFDQMEKRSGNFLHTSNEIIVEVPDGKVPLDNIVGFESLGEFEDDVLTRF